MLTESVSVCALQRHSHLKSGAKASTGVRIIGGEWRGRKLSVVDAEGLRPTPDRIRETLFNWLAPHCRGARVLDCFAGSGALGLEALSRGAAALVALENNRAALKGLQLSLIHI